MTWVVVSESKRHVMRDQSYASAPGPAIPAGRMHGGSPYDDRTLCGEVVGDNWHTWHWLEFPRTYGVHCEPCLHAALSAQADGLDALPDQEPAASA